MHRLLIICGPTATGKTALGIRLAKKFDGEILSADSRQVYRGMDIGTGKDVPENSKFEIRPIRQDFDDELSRIAQGKNSKLQLKNQKLTLGSYAVDNVRIWGLDIVEPDYPFNVADYVDYSQAVLRDVWRRGRVPIVVGGTGLYIQSLLKPPVTLRIPPNEKLRRELEMYSVEGLQQRLRYIDKSKWEAMNSSDKINPRRLIRAIEIARFTRKDLASASAPLATTDVLKIGLSLPREQLYQRIDKRVEKRIRQGMETEVRRLLAWGLSSEAQSLSGTGYREFVQKLPGPDSELTNDDLKEIIQKWKFAEHDYARRQLTWFNKDKDIKWFDASSPRWEEKVARFVYGWYTRVNGRSQS